MITFVLGLVAEPPAAQYVYKADPRRQAVLDGERLITKFNCDGCHTLRMESWEFDYDPKTFPEPPPFDDFAFEKPHFTPKELADSKQVDIRGLGHAKVTGMVNPEVAEDDDGNPHYYFGLWSSVPINGQPWIVGAGPRLPVQESQITKKIPPSRRQLRPAVASRGAGHGASDESQRQGERRLGLGATAALERRQ